jgi:hypothetical protein
MADAAFLHRDLVAGQLGRFEFGGFQRQVTVCTACAMAAPQPRARRLQTERATAASKIHVFMASS